MSSSGDAVPTSVIINNIRKTQRGHIAELAYEIRGQILFLLWMYESL
jgi:hypothetical protein